MNKQTEKKISEERKNLGKVVAKARQEKGWSQTEMANRLEVTLRQYSKYEGGDFPKYKRETVRLIDEILGTSIYKSLYSDSTGKMEHGNELNSSGDLSEIMSDMKSWQVTVDATLTVLISELTPLIASHTDKSNAAVSAQLKKDVHNEIMNRVAELSKEG